MNPISLTLQLVMTAKETFLPTAGDVQTPGQPINHTGFNYVPPQDLNASSTLWPVAGCAYIQVPVGNATVTIDLTNLTVKLNASQSYTVNGTGKKVRGIILSTIGTSVAPLNNSANIVVQPGGSNPYTLDGSSYEFVLGPGECRPIWKGNNAPAVAAGCKTIEFTGTVAGDAINVGIIFG